VQYLIIAFSCVILLIQYLSNRAFWLDESAIALNILNRDYLGLLKPLDYGQLTPILFLLISKFTAYILPNTELGLRLFPLLAFIGSLFTFKSILHSILKSDISRVIILSFFAFNLSYLYFSSEFKQYIVDVAVALLIILLNLKSYPSEVKKYTRITLFYCMAILLSHVAILIIFTLSIYNLWQQWEKKTINKTFFVSHLLFAIYFALFYFTFMYHHPLQGAMEKYWQHSFLPTSSFNEFILFFKHKFSMIFADFFQFGKIIGGAFMLLFIFGIVASFKTKNYPIIIIALTPIALHLILSALKAYPFDLRLILYLTPLILILMGIGLDFIVTNYPSFTNPLLLLAIIPILFIGIKITNKEYPLQREEIKSSYNFLKTKIKAEDKIVVYWQSDYTYQYYKRTGLFNHSNEDAAIRLKTDENKDSLLSAKNNWILFTHLNKEKETTLLNTLGPNYLIQEAYRTTGSSLYLVRKNP
jgi:hypothetical protein